MSFTSDGLSVKRFNEILELINSDFSKEAGVPIDVSATSAASAINSAISKQIAELWEAMEGIYDSRDILKAEGLALDELGLRAGLQRIPDQRTRGQAFFVGDNGTIISASSLMTSVTNDQFQPVEEVLITTTSCYETNFSINTLLPNTTYQVSIDGTQYNYTSQPSDTKADVLQGLYNQLSAGAGFFTTTIIEEEINIKSISLSTFLSISSSTYITFNETTTAANIQSVEFGLIAGDPYSVVNIATFINGWTGIYNPLDLTLGRGSESDIEFRNRILNNYNTIKGGTHIGIKNAVNDVEGVISVEVFENATDTIDTSKNPNIPPASYLPIVYGGLDEDVAKVIFETKPVGIQVVGNEEVTFTDDYGQQQTVYFNRPDILYFYIKIYVKTFSEEEFPSNGKELIKETCFNYGATLDIGDDVIPQRFVGQIYNNVEGVEDLSVMVASSLDSNHQIREYEITLNSSTYNSGVTFGFDIDGNGFSYTTTGTESSSDILTNFSVNINTSFSASYAAYVLNNVLHIRAKRDFSVMTFSNLTSEVTLYEPTLVFSRLKTSVATYQVPVFANTRMFVELVN